MIYSFQQVTITLNCAVLCSAVFFGCKNIISILLKGLLIVESITKLAISNVSGYLPKKALFLYGEGDTGKSKLLELMSLLIGNENYCAMDLKGIEERFGTAPLWRKRLAGSPDMSAMKIGELKIFKKLTGGDYIDFEFKGKDKITDRFNGLLIFCSNDLPKFGGDKGNHVYERMILINCSNIIPKEKRDRKLIEKLYSEREAIVYNAVLAFKTLKSNGFNFDIPDECIANIEDYKTENDNVRQFIDECTNERTEGNRRKIALVEIFRNVRK